MARFGGHRGVTKKDGSTGDSWHSYDCGYCGDGVSGAVVATKDEVKWLECTTCGEGSVISGGRLSPSFPVGPTLEGLPAELSAAYDEARRCMSVQSYTATELICRKILMHISVDKGAKKGLSFADYLDHLKAAGYVTPPMMGWVDLIRTHGNQATHTIPSPDAKRAEGSSRKEVHGREVADPRLQPSR